MNFCSSLILVIGLISPIAVDSYSGEVQIQAYRHGMTCANWVGDCRPENVAWDDCIKEPRNVINAGDAALANSALSQTAEIGDILSQNNEVPDIIFTSNMISPIETALKMFPNRKVYVAPYIVDTNPDNRPLDVEDQMIIMRREFGKSIENIDFSLIDDAMTEYDEKSCRKGVVMSPRCTPSYEKFLVWLSKTFLSLKTKVPEDIKQKILSNQPLKIAISGHGTQMRYQIVNVDKKYSLPPNVGFFAEYKAKEGAEGQELTRTDGNDDEIWIKLDITLQGKYDACAHTDYDVISRCVAMNQKEYNTIVGRFENPTDKCPDGEKETVKVNFFQALRAYVNFQVSALHSLTTAVQNGA